MIRSHKALRQQRLIRFSIGLLHTFSVTFADHCVLRLEAGVTIDFGMDLRKYGILYKGPRPVGRPLRSVTYWNQPLPLCHVVGNYNLSLLFFCDRQNRQYDTVSVEGLELDFLLERVDPIHHAPC